MTNDEEPRSRLDLAAIMLALLVIAVMAFLTMDLWPFHAGGSHPR